MTIELTAEEKTIIIEQHMKAIAYAEYNAILSLAQENALSNPNAETILSLNTKIQDSISQKQILQDELDSLQ
jgi:hypothetical protein